MRFTDSLDGIGEDDLEGFFDGWPNPPSPATHMRILKGSSHVELAVLEVGKVVGYITVISDGVSSAYIPHLEVLPAFRGKGIGSELVNRALQYYKCIYMIDLICDEDVRPFYEGLGFRAGRGMFIRNYERQNCENS
ncbi:MAG: GNAT family N-acetyltransferase [Candidatus Latescibacteria bacterium]|nr:GNAT family N-acetyltransferase [Candidatus Latescibacterota bacterium]MBT4140467.1 GNAT family N-acetyltransferase [Candidatus Latescibacterota bacterium]MBT5831428.1 GNAT family N-acetyltransferase [Candidatus Latescibacterota bacterium]